MKKNFTGPLSQFTSLVQVPVKGVTFRSPDGADVTAAVLSHLPPDLQTAVACVDVFHASKGGAKAMAESMQVPFLGCVPLDPQIGKAAEQGGSIQDIKTAPSLPAFNSIVNGKPWSVILSSKLNSTCWRYFNPVNVMCMTVNKQFSG